MWQPPARVWAFFYSFLVRSTVLSFMRKHNNTGKGQERYASYFDNEGVQWPCLVWGWQV